MILDQMYQNVLNFDFESLVLKVEKDSELRDIKLIEAKSKFDIVGEISKREKKEVIGLSAQEKAILKSIGLNIKDAQTLIKQARQ